jgi:hypothetical protein
MTSPRVVDPSSRLDRLASFKPNPIAMPQLPPARIPLGALPLERRNLAMRERLVSRVRAEFNEMPGLTLTMLQARRLFGLPPDACTRILGGLAAEGLLRRLPDGAYARRDTRP